jgi:transcriptional regulator with XRE-family HTH domain
VDSQGLLADFGARVRAARLRAGLSQEELAHRAGLDRTYVSGVERGRRNISLANICRVAAALDIDPAVLVERLGTA